MCILNWFYRRFRSKHKACSHKLDPEDETIILCEDLTDIERCVCQKSPPSGKKGGTTPPVSSPPPEKSKKLKAESIQISYYPCAPSPFSSIRVSTASEKSKYAIKSDQSIMLSNTTSSSVPVSFQSDTDITSEDSEAVDDEENYDIEFSGGDEQEEEGIDEEDDVAKLITCRQAEECDDEDVKSKEEEEVAGESEYSISVADGSRKDTDSSGKDVNSSGKGSDGSGKDSNGSGKGTDGSGKATVSSKGRAVSWKSRSSSKSAK